MVPHRRRAATAIEGLLLLISAACSPVTNLPTQTSAATAVPTSTQATPTLAISSPTPVPSTARRSPAPLAAARPSDLVVRIDALGELCCPSPVLVATVDGRLVTKAEDGTLVERRLTVGGAQRLRDEVLGSGIFVGDRVVELELAAGATPVQHGLSFRTFRVWNGARTASVTSPIVQQSEEKLYKPSPIRTQLDALAVRLKAPETWLPVSAWNVATPKAYVPDGFRLVTSMEPVGGSQPDVDAVNWPFNPPIPDFGEPLAASTQVFVPIGPGTRPLRCATLDATDSRAARAALERAAATVDDLPDSAFATGLTWRAAGSGIVLYFQALMPDQSSCADPY